MRLYVFIPLLSIAFVFGCAGQNAFFGKYKNPNRYWGDEFILKEDLTFSYKCHNKTTEKIEFTDSASGTFTLVKDTIILTYLTNSYYPFISDSPKDSARWTIIDPYGYFGNRPQKLYWKKKKIYYITATAGNILKSKEEHLRLVK